MFKHAFQLPFQYTLRNVYAKKRYHLIKVKNIVLSNERKHLKYYYFVGPSSVNTNQYWISNIKEKDELINWGDPVGVDTTQFVQD